MEKARQLMAAKGISFHAACRELGQHAAAARAHKRRLSTPPSKPWYDK